MQRPEGGMGRRARPPGGPTMILAGGEFRRESKHFDHAAMGPQLVEDYSLSAGLSSAWELLSLLWRGGALET